jgi:hypothetical protein
MNSQDKNIKKTPWLYHGVEFKTEDVGKYEAFCYIITHIPSGKKYLGKKNLWQRRKNPKTKKRVKSASDWQNYWSSSEELQEWVKLEGEENFKREIIALSNLPAAINFLEVKLQWDYKVLESDEWINSNIAGKWFKERSQKYLREDLVF